MLARFTNFPTVVKIMNLNLFGLESTYSFGKPPFFSNWSKLKVILFNLSQAALAGCLALRNTSGYQATDQDMVFFGARFAYLPFYQCLVFHIPLVLLLHSCHILPPSKNSGWPVPKSCASCYNNIPTHPKSIY